MTCERCNGLFIPVSFVGVSWEFDGLKCLNCGHITDPLLKKNKARPAQNDAPHYSGSSRDMEAGPGTLNAAQSHKAGL